MSDKLLIAAGCSNTDPNWWQYKNNGVMTWPQIVSQETGWNFINLGVAGQGNAAIENTVYDAVMENKDRDIVVMVFWTEPGRINIFDWDHIQLHGNKERYTKHSRIEKRYQTVDAEEYIKRFDELNNWSYVAWLKDRNYLPNSHEKDPYDQHLKYGYLLQDLLKKNFKTYTTDLEQYFKIDRLILNASLRSIIRTKRFLDSLNIKSVHKPSLSLVGHITKCYPYWDDEFDNLSISEKAISARRKEYIERYCAAHPIIKELNWSRSDWSNGFASSNAREKNWLLECGHPNQDGHEEIARRFMEEYDEQ